MNLSPHLDAPILALAVLLVLGAWTWRAYARTLTPIGAARRRFLLALRLTASLLLALMLGGLSLGVERVSEEQPLLRVLVDASASMARPAAGEAGSSRYDRARATVGEVEQRWGERLRIEARPFGDGLETGPLPESATAPVTDLGAALAALPPAIPGEALLVISDGCDTEGGLWSSRLDDGRVIHALALGDSLSPPDLRIERVEAMSILRKGRRLPLTVVLAAAGGAPRSGLCRIREGETLLAEVEWSLEPGEAQARLDFSLEVEGLGQHLLEVEVSGEGEDRSPENNRRLHALRVVESRMKVLALAGRPDWDLAAIVQGLRGEEALALELVSAGPEGRLRRTATGADWLPDEEEVHGLLLHSWHPAWDADLLERLRLRGGALLMAGFLERPGRARLPADWRLDFEGTPATLREQSVEWGSGAARHPALQGAMVAGPRPREQPPLETVGFNPLVTGRALLSTGVDVVLATRELGGKRLATCSGRGFWRWALRGEGGALLHAELFSGLLRWLSREDPPERLVVEWGEALIASRPGRLSAEVFDADFRPQAEADLEWSLLRADTLLAAGRFAPGAEAAFAAVLPALPVGVYRLAVSADLPSGERLERELELPVLLPRRELSDLASRPETLRWLAARGGGQFILDGELAALDNHLDFTPRLQRSRSLRRLWQHPLAFLLILTLLGLEWGLRKRFGMI